MAPSANPRVLCYAPYNRWALHGRWEMTILHGLKLRGADVDYVLCDGLYSDCDIHWDALNPRPANACGNCQLEQVKLVTSMGIDFHWLGRYLMPDEAREARRWADALAPEELLGATYGAWAVGAWIRGSVQSHLRRSELDLADPAVARVVRSYVFSGLVACFALDRLLDESDPDVLLVFNGRLSSTRVALELARARGIRTIAHETGNRNETIRLFENGTCLSLEPVRQFWRDWADVPLDAEELEAVTRALARREHGGDLGSAFSPPPRPSAGELERLGLTPGRPLWALFTSSDDETAGEPGWESPFASQPEWVARTIALAARHPELDLVVRVHPNTGGRRSKGTNQLLKAEMERLGRDLPPNVRMVAPDDDVSSYSLMNACSVGLVWASTVGVELACKGKHVVVASGNVVGGTSFVTTIADAADYEATVEPLAALPAGASSPHVLRLALRFAHGFFYKFAIPFPLVRVPAVNVSELAYTSLEALMPGRDATLDRCARILLQGESPVPAPTAAERARPTDAEDAHLTAARPRAVTGLAFAEEIIADATLLQAWARTFAGRDDVTLVIHTLADQVERLVAVVEQAGLGDADGPDLVAVEADAATLASIDAVFSRHALAEAELAAPRYDETSIAALAA